MESGKMIGGLAAVLVLSMLFALAMPRKPAGPGGRPGDVESRAPAKPAPPPTPAPTPQGPVDLAGGVWAPAGFGFRMPAPEGWRDTRRRDNAYLQVDADSMLPGSFSALRLPNLFGKDLEGLLEENRAELSASGQFELRAIEIVDVDGARALRMEYEGTPRDGEPVHFVGTIWLDGDDQLVLTYSSTTEAWERWAGPVRRSLEGLRIERQR